MTEPRRSRTNLIAAGALIAAIAAIASLQAAERGPTTLTIDTPAIDAPIEASAGERVPIEGVSRGMEGCTLETHGVSIPLADGRFAGELPAPAAPGRHLFFVEAMCPDGLRHRHARPVNVGLDHVVDRVEIARIHVSAPTLEAQLSEQLPPLLNAQVDPFLDELAVALETWSENLGTPDWIVSTVELEEESTIVARDARVRLDEDGVHLDLDLDVDVGVVVHREPLIRRRRRGEERFFRIGLDDRFRPVSGRVGITSWPEVSVDDVTLESQYCGDRVGNRTMRRVCERVVDWIYVRVGRWLERELETQANEYLASLDLGGFFSDSVLAWAEQVDLQGRTGALLDGADLRLARTHQGADGFAFSLEVDGPWLGEATSADVTVEDSDAPVDVTLRIALLNRVLAAAFDRPLVDALDEMSGLAQATGAAEGLQQAIRRVEEFTRSGGSSEVAEMRAMLETVGLRYVDDFTVTPVLRIGASDRVAVSVHDLRPFESRRAHEHAAISVSAATEVDLVPAEYSVRLVADRELLTRQLAFEVLSTTEEPLTPLVALRYDALGTFMLGQLLRIGGWVDDEPLIDDDFLEALLSALPPIPTHFANDEYMVILGDLRGDDAEQTVRLTARVVERGPR